MTISYDKVSSDYIQKCLAEEDFNQLIELFGRWVQGDLNSLFHDFIYDALQDDEYPALYLLQYLDTVHDIQFQSTGWELCKLVQVQEESSSEALEVNDV